MSWLTRRLSVRERPVSDVPRPVLALLVLALAAQIAWHALAPAPRLQAAALAPPPSLAVLRLAAMGEPIALSKLLMLHVQAADSQTGAHGLYDGIDYARLEQWLTRISDLDPRAEYPLIAASHLYAEVRDDAKRRRMLDFVYQRFLLEPNLRWRALAHVTMVAKYQLHDLPLAQRYASAIRRLASGPQVPGWARQMEVFVLEDMNELESAKILLGGMIASGQVSDPQERRFLQERLQQLIARTRPK